MESIIAAQILKGEKKKKSNEQDLKIATEKKGRKKKSKAQQREEAENALQQGRAVPRPWLL